MNVRPILAAALAALSLPLSALAHEAPSPHHGAAGVAGLHQSVLHGLRTGQLSAREAWHLERDIDHVARMHAHAWRDGDIHRHEARRLEREHERARWAIERQMHDHEHGDPRSHDSRRMQAYVEQRLHEHRQPHTEAHGWRR